MTYISKCYAFMAGILLGLIIGLYFSLAVIVLK